MDICQSVFTSFFVRAALGQYEIEKPAQLLRLSPLLLWKPSAPLKAANTWCPAIS